MMSDASGFCFRDRRVQPSLTNQTLSITRLPQNNTRSAQNLVTCLYKTTINGHCHLLLVTWCRSLMGQKLSVSFDYPACTQRCSVDVRPWRFWKKQGSKSFAVGDKQIEMFWDLSSAKYSRGPEPHESFYVAIGCNNEAVLLLGDMHKVALKKFHAQSPPSEATLVSRKEHVYGKELYTTKARLCEQGRAHDIAIECHVSADGGSSHLSVRVDKQTVIHVTSLMWKFRGNQTIQIDGTVVDVFWDVHNWLFKGDEGHAVFMFHTFCVHGKQWNSEMEWPSCANGHLSMSMNKQNHISDGLWASVLQLPIQEKGQSFSLLLYAHNNE